MINALRGCRYPEIPVNFVDLGLVYDVEVESEKRVRVSMNLGLRMSTSSSCAVRSGSRPG